MSDNSISSPSYTSSPQSIVEDNNEYKIIFVRWNESEKPLEYLAKQVNAEIKNGYTPIGGITVIDQTIGGTARHDRHVLMPAGYSQTLFRKRNVPDGGKLNKKKSKKSIVKRKNKTRRHYK